MAVPTPTFLLLAAFICSIVGRAFLVRAAWEISKGWGIAVACVPFAPFFFRRNYKELAQEGQTWRTMTTIFTVAFGAITGSTASTGQLWAMVPEKYRPASLTEKAEPGQDSSSPESATAPAAAPATPVPAPPSYAERVAANQQEFARLGDVYENLKTERGYLRKHDDEGIKAYNELAAKYQADLVKARAEQTELVKLVAKK